MRVHAKGDRRVSVPEPGGDDMDRNAVEQERCGVNVPQVVDARVR